MSFSNGLPQRRGRQAAIVGTSFRNVQASQIPYPKPDLLRQPPGPNRAPTKRRRTASIGDDGATGLVIHGTHDFSPMEGTNPDSADPPISGDTLANPDFPISYNGRGTLKFVSPIRITTIDGPLNVNGEVYSHSGLLGSGGGGGGGSDHATWTVTVGATGAGANLVENSGLTDTSYHISNDNVSILCHFTWSGKGSVLDGDTIFIKGIPHTIATQLHRMPVVATGIFPTALSSTFHLIGASGSDEFQLSSVDTGTGVETVITGAELDTTGSICFSFVYHGVA